jgi:hypothetical protein
MTEKPAGTLVHEWSVSEASCLFGAQVVDQSTIEAVLLTKQLSRTNVSYAPDHPWKRGNDLMLFALCITHHDTLGSP